MRCLCLGTLLAALFSPGSPCAAAEEPAAPLDPTLAKLSEWIGGTWVNDDPKFRVEFRYEWIFGKAAIRGIGLIDKGGPHQTPVEVTLGWDAAKQAVYYLDHHGADRVYHGTVKLEDGTLRFEFGALVGPEGRWRNLVKINGRDSYQFTISELRDGSWSPIVTQSMKRVLEPPDASRLVTEGIIEAPPEAVWAALTTKEGLESWMVAHAEVDFRIGGTIRTSYRSESKIGDPNTIENVILSFEPNRFYSIKVAKPPAGFPFPEAIKKVWHVLYLEEAGPGRTRVREVGLGYGSDEESKKLRAFFERGNAYTLQALQEKFAKAKDK